MPCLLSVESREVTIIGNTSWSRGNFLFNHLVSVTKLRVIGHLISVTKLHVFNHLESVTKLHVFNHLASVAKPQVFYYLVSDAKIFDIIYQLSPLLENTCSFVTESK
jgi:hypothetical protein